MRLIDLRGNKIGPGAIRILAESLERAERVKHVYVHQGGKIEALGTKTTSSNNDTLSSTAAASTSGSSSAPPAPLVTVETVCVVDVRDNNAAGAAHPYELEQIKAPSGMDSSKNTKSSTEFNPGAMTNMTKTLAASAALLNAANSTGKKKKDKKESKENKTSGGGTVQPNASSSEPAAVTLKQQKKMQQRVSLYMCSKFIH